MIEGTRDLTRTTKPQISSLFETLDPPNFFILHFPRKFSISNAQVPNVSHCNPKCKARTSN
uniref:Uncharacterized protein n=1 Tax=Rhizophora mucronata TaxID=61149 RepID=A0A2P2M6E4_RHIMU